MDLGNKEIKKKLVKHSKELLTLYNEYFIINKSTSNFDGFTEKIDFGRIEYETNGNSRKYFMIVPEKPSNKLIWDDLLSHLDNISFLNELKTLGNNLLDLIGKIWLFLEQKLKLIFKNYDDIYFDLKITVNLVLRSLDDSNLLQVKPQKDIFVIDGYNTIHSKYEDKLRQVSENLISLSNDTELTALISSKKSLKIQYEEKVKAVKEFFYYQQDLIERKENYFIGRCTTCNSLLLTFFKNDKKEKIISLRADFEILHRFFDQNLYKLKLAQLDQIWIRKKENIIKNF